MDLAERLDRVEAELRGLRDIEALRHLLSTYGFNADLGRVEQYLDGWTDDGVYDLSEDMQLEGRAALEGLMSDPTGFQKLQIENRSQHLVANLFIKVTGDAAWAEGYSVVMLAGEDGVKIFAAGYNHWDFVRTAKGWRMTRRQRRVIGGPTWGGDVIASYLEPAN